MRTYTSKVKFWAECKAQNKCSVSRLMRNSEFAKVTYVGADEWIHSGSIFLQRLCFGFRASLTHPFPPPTANSHFNQPVFANTARPVAPHRSPAPQMSLFFYTYTYYQLLTADFYFAGLTRHCHKSE